MSTQNSKGTAVITGASSGIGAVYADRLAQRGYDPLLVARDQKRLSERSTGLIAKTGCTVEILPADLTLKSDLLRVEERLRSDHAVSALVNNAGFGATSKLADSKIEKLENMIQLNVTALTRLTAAVLPGFLERGQGLIINIASIVALAPELLNGTYSGTKAYVVNLTQSLHHEVGDKGIRVQAVLPGATSTEFWDRAGLPVDNLPEQAVMSADEMVDASLAGLDQQELITIPSLLNLADWQKFEDARLALGPNLSHRYPAARYGIHSVR
ncbi:MAG TPA: SDR family oxidoreductase [Chthoniobacterales bacterium]|nr:SDR family oxidoreductase [Chthoniobacterales bacterium]